MPVVSRIGAAMASTLLLLAPAIWNRFPLLQFDTGGYLVRWFEGYLVPSRSTVFGLYLNIFATPDFWPVVVLQAALTVWLLALLLRALGYGGRPMLLLGVTTALSGITTLPWLTSILLTDIFAGLAVLAAAALAWWYCRIGAASGIARGIAAVALGAVMLVSSNYVVAGRLAWTPGGIALSFGRMLQDGIVNRYLADHCPEQRLKLCKHRHELPTDADVFFWSGKGSIFNNLGRFAGLGDEMSEIVVGSLRDYPLWQVELALAATAHQLTRVATGEGVVNTVWHTYWAIDRFAPRAAASMHAARQ